MTNKIDKTEKFVSVIEDISTDFDNDSFGNLDLDIDIDIKSINLDNLKDEIRSDGGLDLDLDLDLDLELDSSILEPENNTEEYNQNEELFKQNKKRLNEIFQRNLEYSGYALKGKSISKTRIVNNKMSGLKKILKNKIESIIENKCLSENDLITSLKSMGVALSNLKEILLNQISVSDESSIPEIINLRNIDKNFDKIANTINIGSDLLLSDRSIKQDIIEAILNTFSEYDTIYRTLSMNLDESEVKLRSLLTTDNVIAEVEHMELNLMNFEQVVTCPYCRREQKHELIKFKNVLDNYLQRSDEKNIMFAHIPMICDECKTVVLLEAKMEETLNSIMVNQKDELVRNYYNSESNTGNSSTEVRTVIKPTKSVLEEFSTIKLTGTDITDKLRIFETADTIFNKRRNMFKETALYNLTNTMKEICIESDSEVLKNKCYSIVKLNSQFITAEKFPTFSEKVVRSFMSTTLFSDMMRTYKSKILYMKIRIGLQKDRKVLNDLLTEKTENNDNISEEITSRIAYLNVSLANINNFKQIPKENNRNLLLTYLKIIEEDLNKLDNLISKQDIAIMSGLEFFLDNSELIAFTITSYSNVYSIDELKNICYTDILFNSVIDRMKESYSLIKWSKLLMSEDISKLKRHSIQEYNENAMSNKLKKCYNVLGIVEPYINNTRLNKFLLDDYKYRSDLDLLKSALANNRKYQVYYYLIDLYKKEVKSNSGFDVVRDLIIKFGLELPNEDNELFEISNSSVYFEKAMYLIEVGFKREVVIDTIRNNSNLISSWNALGARKSKNQGIKTYLANTKVEVIASNFYYTKTMLDLLNIIKVISDWSKTQTLETSLFEVNSELRTSMFNKCKDIYINDKISLLSKCHKLRFKKENEYLSKVEVDLKVGRILLKELLSKQPATDFLNVLNYDNFEDTDDISREYTEIEKCYFVMEQGVDSLKTNKQVILATICDIVYGDREDIDSYLAEIIDKSPEIYKESITILYKILANITWESTLIENYLKWDMDILSEYTQELIKILEKIREESISNYTELTSIFSMSTNFKMR